MNKEMVKELDHLNRELLASVSLSLKSLESLQENGEVSYNSDQWDVIVKLTERMLSSASLTGKMLEQIYLVMAMDVGGECIIKRAIELLNKDKFEVLVKYAQYCPYPETRKQIVDSLGETGYDFASTYLVKYLFDDCGHIVSRTLLSLEKVNKKLAQKHARQYVFHNDEDVKRVATDILSRAGE